MKLNIRRKPIASALKLPSWREIVRRFSFTRPDPLAAIHQLRDAGVAAQSSGPEYFKSKRTRRPAYALEPVEPRLLMSADLSYSTAVSGEQFYLVATGSRSFALDANSVNPANQVASFTQIGSNNSVSINIIDTIGFSNSNTLHVDLDTFNLLDSPFFSAHGGLNITFDEGKSIAAGVASNPDTLSVDATGANIGFGLSIESNSGITSSGSASITQGDFSLTSLQKASDSETNGLFAIGNTGVTLTGANFTVVNGAFSATAHGDVTASTNGLGMSAISGALISDNSTSTISVTGGTTIHANSIVLDANVDGTMSATADPSVIQLVVVQGSAHPSVTTGCGHGHRDRRIERHHQRVDDAVRRRQRVRGRGCGQHYFFEQRDADGHGRRGGQCDIGRSVPQRQQHAERHDHRRRKRRQLGRRRRGLGDNRRYNRQ
jgi:hypothetical protein